MKKEFWYIVASCLVIFVIGGTFYIIKTAGKKEAPKVEQTTETTTKESSSSSFSSIDPNNQYFEEAKRVLERPYRPYPSTDHAQEVAQELATALKKIEDLPYSEAIALTGNNENGFSLTGAPMMQTMVMAIHVNELRFNPKKIYVTYSDSDDVYQFIFPLQKGEFTDEGYKVAYFAGNYNRITKQFGVIKYFAAPGTVGAVYR